MAKSTGRIISVPVPVPVAHLVQNENGIALAAVTALLVQQDIQFGLLTCACRNGSNVFLYNLLIAADDLIMIGQVQLVW